MRFIVIDDDGQALRAFWTMEQARAFCSEGWTITVKPKPVPRPAGTAYSQALQAVGASPF